MIHRAELHLVPHRPAVPTARPFTCTSLGQMAAGGLGNLGMPWWEMGRSETGA